MTETIGKITLDYRHYPGEDLYCDGGIEEELLSIAKTYSSVEFPAIIEEKKSWPLLYHLSFLRENIVDWLPMDKSMKVMEVGSGCGAITGKLAEKAGEVTCIELSRRRSRINAYRHMEQEGVTIHVGNFQEVEKGLACDYDYVCLIGVFEYGQSYIGGDRPFHGFFQMVKRHVKPGGRLIIAIENRYGLKYWAGCREDHLGGFFCGLEGYPDGGGVRTFSRKGLEGIFRECGEEEYSFYYPYPDYKFMHTLFSDRRLPMIGELTDNQRNFDRDRMALFDEKNVYDGIIEEGLFPFYSNSYLAVVGKSIETEYCRYSNDRSREKAIKTEIFTDHGKKKVRKCALAPVGADHIRQIQASYEKLSARYAGSGLAVNRCLLREGRLPYVELEYVEGAPLARLFDERLRRGDEEGFFALFEEYVDRIRYGEDKPIANVDMIFSNILVQGDTWTLIDYEWTCGRQTDVQEIAFRSLYCYLLENEARNRLDMSRALAYIGIPAGEIEDYREREKRFQSRVMGKRLSLGEIRAALQKASYVPQDWLEKISQWEAKGSVQIYEDKGQGYREEESYFLEGIAMPPVHPGEGYRASFSIEAEGTVKRLRIDPAMRPCICRVERLAVNGETVDLGNRRILTANGERAGNCFVFSHDDPNIHLHLQRLANRRRCWIEAKMEILPVNEGFTGELENGLKRKIRL